MTKIPMTTNLTVQSTSQQTSKSNKSGNKRGMYDRTPYTCPVCKRTLKGLPALNKHINRFHKEHNIDSSPEREAATLGQMLTNIVKRIETGDPIFIEPEVVDKLRKQDLETQLSLRVLCYNVMTDIIKSLRMVKEVNDELCTRFSDSTKIRNMSTSDLVKYKREVTSCALKAMTCTQDITGVKFGQDELMMSRMLEAFNAFTDRVIADKKFGKDAIDVQPNDIIPKTPAEREAMRVQYLIEKYNEAKREKDSNMNN